MFGTDTPLHSLLIKPVQRIAKYPLLMKVSHCQAKLQNLYPTDYCSVCFSELPIVIMTSH